VLRHEGKEKFSTNEISLKSKFLPKYRLGTVLVKTSACSYHPRFTGMRSQDPDQSLYGSSTMTCNPGLGW
jgi:hypothetical protein